MVGLSHSFPISWATSIEGHLKEPESSSEEGAIVSVSSHEGHPYMAVKTTPVTHHAAYIYHRKMLPFLPTTLRKILLHAPSAIYLSSRTLKKELFGEKYMEGVGEYVRFLVDPYLEDYEVWEKDWLARINSKSDAVSCTPERDFWKLSPLMLISYLRVNLAVPHTYLLLSWTKSSSFVNQHFSPQVLRITFWKLVDIYVQLSRVRFFFFEEILPVDHSRSLSKKFAKLSDFRVVWTTIPQPQNSRG